MVASPRSDAIGHGQAALVPAGSGVRTVAPDPSLPVECPFCIFTATQRAVREHLQMLHRERIAAAQAYAEMVARGVAEQDARAAANEMVRAALEGGPGRYRRARDG